MKPLVLLPHKPDGTATADDDRSLRQSRESLRAKLRSYNNQSQSSISYKGSTFTSRHELDNRGSGFLGSRRDTRYTPGPGYYRKVSQAYNYLNEKPTTSRFHSPIRPSAPDQRTVAADVVKKLDQINATPGPFEYEPFKQVKHSYSLREARKVAHPRRKLRHIAPNVPTSLDAGEFGYGAGPGSYNVARATDALLFKAHNFTIGSEGIDAKGWPKELSSRMRWVLPPGRSPRQGVSESARAGPGAYRSHQGWLNTLARSPSKTARFERERRLITKAEARRWTEARDEMWRSMHRLASNSRLYGIQNLDDALAANSSFSQKTDISDVSRYSLRKPGQLNDSDFFDIKQTSKTSMVPPLSLPPISTPERSTLQYTVLPGTQSARPDRYNSGPYTEDTRDCKSARLGKNLSSNTLSFHSSPIKSHHELPDIQRFHLERNLSSRNFIAENKMCASLSGQSMELKKHRSERALFHASLRELALTHKDEAEHAKYEQYRKKYDEATTRITSIQQRKWLKTLILHKSIMTFKAVVNHRRQKALSKTAFVALVESRRRTFYAWKRFVRDQKQIWAISKLSILVPPMVQRFRERRKDKYVDIIVALLKAVKAAPLALVGFRKYMSAMRRLRSFLKDSTSRYYYQKQIIGMQWNKCIEYLRVQALKKRLLAYEQQSANGGSPQANQRRNSIGTLLSNLKVTSAIQMADSAFTDNFMISTSDVYHKDLPNEDDETSNIVTSLEMGGRSSTDIPNYVRNTVRNQHEAIAFHDNAYVPGWFRNILSKDTQPNRVVSDESSNQKSSISVNNKSRTTAGVSNSNATRRVTDNVVRFSEQSDISDSEEETEVHFTLLADQDRRHIFEEIFCVNAPEVVTRDAGSTFLSPQAFVAQAPIAKEIGQAELHVGKLPGILAVKTKQASLNAKLRALAGRNNGVLTSVDVTSLAVGAKFPKVGKRLSADMAAHQSRVIAEWPVVPDDRKHELITRLLIQKRAAHSRYTHHFAQVVQHWHALAEEDLARMEAKALLLKGSVNEVESARLREFLQLKQPQPSSFTPLIPYRILLPIVTRAIQEQLIESYKGNT